MQFSKPAENKALSLSKPFLPLRFELRSRNWQELRNPFVMAAIFNGASFLASLYTIALGESLIFPLLIAVASLAVTIATIIALRTNGGSASSTETVAAPGPIPDQRFNPL